MLVWEPPQYLRLSWQLGPEWQAGVPDEMASHIDVTFEPIGERRTRVELVHRGLANHGPGWEKIRDGVGAKGGWSEILARFERVIT